MLKQNVKKSICIAPSLQIPLKYSGMDHTVYPTRNTMPAFTSEAFTRWRHYRMRWWTSNYSSLLIYRPREDERLSWPGCLTSGGWFTHISGDPSAEGRVCDWERSSAKTNVLATVPCHSRSTIVTVLLLTFLTFAFLFCCWPLWQFVYRPRWKLVSLQMLSVHYVQFEVLCGCRL